MDKTADAFRTIGEVAEELDLPQHVLRFWETKFNQIRPVKRVGGRRYYRPEDVQLVAAIRILLYSEGYTIRGVQRILKEQGARAVIAASRANGRGPQAPRTEAPRTEEAQTELPAEETAETTLLADPQAELAFEGNETGHAEEDGATRLSPHDRHRMEAILVELDESARILAEARRR